MFKFLCITLLGTVGLLSSASAAEACGGRSCPCPTAAAPPASPANTQAQAGTQVYRNYSYEPTAPAYRGYTPSRGYRGGDPSSNYNAGRKIRGL